MTRPRDVSAVPGVAHEVDDGATRLLQVVLLLAAAMLLTGCGPTPASTAETPINTIPPDAIKTILDWFVAHRNLNWRTGRDARRKRFDQHRGFFVARRAFRLLGWGPAAWVTEPGYATAIARIDNEFGQLESFATAKLNAPGQQGPLTGGSGDRSPPHLDIRDVARQHASDLATHSSVRKRVVNYYTQRRARAMAIIWRAGGIHDSLWQPSADQRTATLQTAALEELLDRRLHAAERMSYQVSNRRETGAGRIDMSAGPGGPWTDGSRVRPFEYPRWSNGEFTAAGVGPISDERGLPPANDWKWESALHRRIVWNHGWSRVRPAAAPGAPEDPTDMYPPFPYSRMLVSGSGLTPAGTVDALFTPAVNLWDRSWMYCDHVVGAIHLTALLLAKRRRTGGDAVFDALVTANPTGYVRVGPALGPPSAHLFNDPASPAFENVGLGPSDFQVGDHLIFWNSILYPLVSTGEWRLENALIVDIESAPEEISTSNPATSSRAGGSIKLHRLVMQGHGTEGRTVGRYEELIGNHLRNGMNDARAAATAAGAGATTASHNGVADRLVRWSPYPDTWSGAGAWWVRVQIGAETHAVVRDRLRKGVIPNPAFPNPAPFADSVYFPLWEPQYSGGWEAYFTARATGPVRVSPRLVPTRVDGTIIPGLHYTGTLWEPLPVVRPKVVP